MQDGASMYWGKPGGCVWDCALRALDRSWHFFLKKGPGGWHRATFGSFGKVTASDSEMEVLVLPYQAEEEGVRWSTGAFQNACAAYGRITPLLLRLLEGPQRPALCNRTRNERSMAPSRSLWWAHGADMTGDAATVPSSLTATEMTGP